MQKCNSATKVMGRQGQQHGSWEHRTVKTLLQQPGHQAFPIHPQTHHQTPLPLLHPQLANPSGVCGLAGDDAAVPQPSLHIHIGRRSRREPPRQFRQAARANCAFRFQQWPVSDSGLGKRRRFYMRICALKENCLLNFISENLARVWQHTKAYSTTEPPGLKP